MQRSGIAFRLALKQDRFVLRSRMVQRGKGEGKMNLPGSQIDH